MTEIHAVKRILLAFTIFYLISCLIYNTAHAESKCQTDYQTPQKRTPNQLHPDQVLTLQNFALPIDSQTLEKYRPRSTDRKKLLESGGPTFQAICGNNQNRNSARLGSNFTELFKSNKRSSFARTDSIRRRLNFIRFATNSNLAKAK